MGSRALFLLRRLSLKSSHLSRLLLHSSPSPRFHASSSPLLPRNLLIVTRSASYGSVDLVLSDGKPRFKINEVDPTRKQKCRSKKRLKLQRKREKRKRKEANRTDPRRIRTKGKRKKERFPTAESRIKYKIEKAKIKEAMLVEKLKKYEVPQVQGPDVKPEVLTGEERFFLKKISQKKSNYVPVGRRGIFGGVILNMHLHWKKHETVKVICRPCKPGQVHEYARDIARLSGGIPIHIIGDDTIVFYRGKNYVQPEVMSPIDTLSKKKALEKSKYEQSLETVRRFISVAEKELELYYRHIALYGDPNSRNADMLYDDGSRDTKKLATGITASVEQGACLNNTDTDISADVSDKELFSLSTDDMHADLSDEANACTTDDDMSTDLSDLEADSEDGRLTEADDDILTDLSDAEGEVDSEDEYVSDTEKNWMKKIESGF